jgi:hypothetical protein
MVERVPPFKRKNGTVRGVRAARCAAPELGARTVSHTRK